jgi:2-polyprenyl-3-methyl-5-hydroxy-6-metoxy-1,4-benzoquinol methylase
MSFSRAKFQEEHEMLRMSMDLDRIYEGYGSTRPNYQAATQSADLFSLRVPTFRKHYLSLLPIEKDARILDLGCGCGEFLYFLQRHGYRNSSGVDLSDRQIDVGRSLGVQNLRRGEIGAVVAGASEEFDFISAIDVLEHVPKNEVVALLERIYLALRSDGRFVCQVPNLAAFYSPLFYMDFSHETPFTAPSLKQVLQLAGFGAIRVLPMGPVVHGAKSALRSILWNGITACLRFIQTIEGGPSDALCSIYSAAILAVADKTAK